MPLNKPDTRAHVQGVAGSYCVDKLAEERRVKKEIQDLYSITCASPRPGCACAR